MNRGALALAVSALCAAGCIEGGPLRSSEAVDESRPLAADGEFVLENTNGSIRISTWDEPRVRVEAVKRARSQAALRALEVAIEGEGSRVSVRSRHPRGGSLFGGSGSVEYDVTVPRGARVSVRNVNGRVEIAGVAGALRARTVNGSLELDDIEGEVEAETTNGSVRARLVRVAGSGRNELRSTNGSVRLVLPRDVGAEIEARTVNGSVSCDFELDGHKSRKRVDGRVGAGGPRFEARTVNGSVHVEQGLSSESARRPAEAAPAASAPAR